MNNSKRQFLKYMTWSLVLVPVVAHTRLTLFRDTVSLSEEIRQTEVGGGMTGVDLSRYYNSTRVDVSLENRQV